MSFAYTPSGTLARRVFPISATGKIVPSKPRTVSTTFFATSGWSASISKVSTILRTSPAVFQPLAVLSSTPSFSLSSSLASLSSFMFPTCSCKTPISSCRVPLDILLSVSAFTAIVLSLFDIVLSSCQKAPPMF